MRFGLVAAAGLAILIPALALAQEGWGQVVLNNQTSSTATLRVDGGFGCGPVFAGNFCPTQVRIGTHTLTVVFDDGRDPVSGQAEVQQGRVFTFTVYDETEETD